MKKLSLILLVIIIGFCSTSCKIMEDSTSGFDQSKTSQAPENGSSATDTPEAGESKAATAAHKATQTSSQTRSSLSRQSSAPSPETEKSNKRILVVDTNINENDLVASYNTLRKSVQECMPGAQIKSTHYEKLSPDLIAQYNPKAIILGGQKSPWTEYSKDKLAKVCKTIRNIDLPLLGICGGHQLIALSYGSTVDRIKVLDPSKAGYEGSWREKGYTKITCDISDDLIFLGLKKEFWGFENHCDEVKDIPFGFVSIATGLNCKIQGMKHKSKPTYGVQFHPEVYNQSYMDDKTILKNFLTKVSH